MSCRRREAGVTLVELMISLATSMLVVMGAFAILSMQRPIFQAQTQIQDSQQALWIAMEFIQRDVRAAGLGFGFCQKNNPTAPGNASRNNRGVVNYWPRSNVSGVVQELQSVELLNAAGGTTDELVLRYANPPGFGAPDGKLSASVSELNTDTSVSVDQGVTFLPNAAGCSAGSQQNYAVPFPVAIIRGVGFEDQVPCNLFQITSVTPGNCPAGPGVIARRSQAEALLNPPSGVTTWTGLTYAVGADSVSNLGPMLEIHYRVAFPTVSAGETPIPVLERVVHTFDGAADQVQRIVDGIEDLQVAASGCDLNGDGVFNEGTTDALRQADEWFYNVAGETVLPMLGAGVNSGCKTLSHLRINLVARTALEQSGAELGGLPALEDRAAGGPDGYRRRVLTQTLAATNLVQ